MDTPRISAEDLAAAVRPNRAVIDKNWSKAALRWRQENPDAFKTWETAHGTVYAYRGWKFYYAKCKDCSGWIQQARFAYTKQRPKHFMNGSPWRQQCDSCQEAKYAALTAQHDDRARGRMSRVRAEQRMIRDAHLGDLGITPPKQGVPARDRDGNVVKVEKVGTWEWKLTYHDGETERI